MGLLVQAVEINFLSLRDRVRNCHPGEAWNRAAAPRHREEPDEVILVWGGGPREDPGHVDGNLSLGWPGKASGPPGRAGQSGWGQGSLGCPRNLIPDRRWKMDAMD